KTKRPVEPMNALTFTVSEELSLSTTVFQVDNVVLLCRIGYTFDINGCQLVEASLPSKKISDLITFGNSIYFTASEEMEDTLYAAICYVRELLSSDGYEHSVFAKICDEDKEYVYRIHDDPYCERICVPVMPEDYELQLIHNGRAIFLEESYEFNHMDSIRSPLLFTNSMIIILC
ncbi:hypothetical protein PRIPAC_90144, partial [Pristionchus pacificus]